MKVKLLISRGARVDGRIRTFKHGDVIDVSDEEGQRLIDNSRAVAVKSSKATKKKPESQEKASE